MKALTQPLKIKLSWNAYYTNFETNLKILHTLPKALNYTPPNNIRCRNIINNHYTIKLTHTLTQSHTPAILTSLPF